MTGVETAALFGFIGCTGTSGKSTMSKSESESDCSWVAGSGAVYVVSSCFSFGRGTFEALTNCDGPFWQEKGRHKTIGEERI